MNLQQATKIVSFLNNYKQHLDKWIVVLIDRQSENDKFSIGVESAAQGNKLIVIYQPINIMSVIIDRGKHLDQHDANDPSLIRQDDNLWEVLFLVYTAIKGGGWDHAL